METKISKTATICEGVRIGKNVIIDDNVYIDCDVIIRDNVHIKKNSFIGARSILGEYLSDFFETRKNKMHSLTIGENAIIRSETIIYGENVIGDYFQTGHRVTIREYSVIGNHVRIGTLSDIQGCCEIQDYVSLHSNVHIGQKSLIKKYAWIFPYVVLTNDPTPPSMKMLGVTVGEFSVIATGAVLLPGVEVGKDALVGASSVVTKKVDDMMVVAGNPAKFLCKITDIKDTDNNCSIYPWRYTFSRGMPWNEMGYDKWEELHCKKK
jgi:acetyltransferase-like isoleucine patch superfamily enzyme